MPICPLPFSLRLLTITSLLCSIRDFSMEKLTASFSSVNEKIQQVSKILPRVICLVLLYNLVLQKFYELLIWFLSFNSRKALLFYFYMPTLVKKYDQRSYPPLQVLTNNDWSILVKFRSGYEYHYFLDYLSSFPCYKFASFSAAKQSYIHIHYKIW